MRCCEVLHDTPVQKISQPLAPAIARLRLGATTMKWERQTHAGGRTGQSGGNASAVPRQEHPNPKPENCGASLGVE